MADTQTNTATEPEVICNHKPGDVWADGCCTSKKNKQAAPEGNLNSDVFVDADIDEQTASSQKD
ncbi:MAG: hypothetical protein ABG776_16845 [Cyanobacteria bacterium J06555_13]